MDNSIIYVIFAACLVKNKKMTDIKVTIKQGDKKKKTVSGDTMGFMGAMTLLFLGLTLYEQQIFYNGNHSLDVAFTFMVSAGIAAIFLILFLACLIGRLFDD